MSSKTSCFNATIFKKNLIHYWPIWSIYTIFLLCMLPLNILMSTNVRYVGLPEQAAQMKIDGYISVLHRIAGSETGVHSWICLIMGVIAAMAVFSYLFKNQSANMMHAFPVTRRELYITNYCSGLVMLLGPILLAFCGAVIVCVVNGITSLEYLMIWLLVMAGESFFFYSMAVLVGMFTGILIAVPVLTGICNFLYIGCRYIVTSLIGTIGYGLSDTYADRSNSILSPVIYMQNKIGIGYDFGGETVGYRIEGMKYLAGYSLAALVLIVLAYLVYKRKRLETTGDVLCVKATKPVFRWGVAACVSFLIAMVLCGILGNVIHTPRGEFALVLVSVLVIGFLMFFLTEMFLQKKFRVMTKKLLTECTVFLALAAAFIISVKCNAFGMENKIPDKEDIASAECSMYYNIKADTPETIDEIAAIHQQIIESKKEFEAFQYQTDWDAETEDRGYVYVEIDYRLKNGSEMVRSYRVPSTSQYMENKDSVAARIYALSMKPENYLRGAFCNNYDEIKIKNMSIDLYDKDLNYNTVTLKDEEAQAVYDAYIKDIQAGHFSLDINYDSTQFYALGINAEVYNERGAISPYEMAERSLAGQKNYFLSISLNKKCTYTVAVLEELGVMSEEQHYMTAEEYAQKAQQKYGY